ncbi:cytochrome c oxidase subunit II [Aureimonas sp. OT7]|uniref:Cytochrome c oxidase subunit 2 n=1 Tax=Aureimonas altamirensis TaxID=370622 RepID=A0A0B1QAT7_9HYPH|nr:MULTISPECIES: cytochrome c oxidase subunit II [Aureimonas]KHJ56022.1 cytochrome B561 [Aureimonas altamirensis]QOG08649.1 cytochrome c oxidase subunit II [Aureimonas sp. OT7]
MLAAVPTLAAAQEGAYLPGQPHPWQLGLQEALSPIEEQIHWFSAYTLWFLIPITIFVALLLAWCIFRYSKHRNPTPSRTSHNTTIEVIWTLAPVLILLCLAIPSFQLLTAQYNPPREPELTVKATGYQWYWGYEYQPAATDPAAAGAAAQEAGAAEAAEPVSYLSYLLREDDRAGQGKEDVAVYPRLLAVDNEMVVPVNTVVRLLTTSADVIHSFAVPSLGVKVDSVPGRINEYWFEATREGILYGQCSELCGRDHAFMPIAVRVVSQEQFDNWLAAAADDLPAANQQLNAEIEAAAGQDVAAR